MAEKKKLSAAERTKIADQIAALQAALDDAEEAEGAAAAADAQEDVEEERQKLAALFDRLGLTEQDYDLLVGAVASGTEERTRAIVREELAAEEEAENDDGSLAGAGKDPAKATPVAPTPPDDAPPPSEHWTKKKLFGKRKEEQDGD